MKVFPFKQQNTVIAKNQMPYAPLPSHLHIQPGHATTVTSCWGITTFREWLSLVIFGRVYITQVTFGRPLQPQHVSTKFQPPVLETESRGCPALD